MDKQTFITQESEFVKERIKELEIEILQTAGDEKGRKELIEGHNKWIDRLIELNDKLENLDKSDIEEETLKLEYQKLQFEIQKFNIETELHRKELRKDVAFEVIDILVKVLIPILIIYVTMRIAELSYTNDQDLKLCDGRIWGVMGWLPKLIKF